MGCPEAAGVGKLHFLVSGDKAIIEKAQRLLLHAGTAGVWEFGENVKAPNVAKLCSNFLIAATIESMAEGIQLAKKSNLDAEKWIAC